jgi:hypothetical protein
MKKIVLVALLAVSLNSLFAQSFMNGVGFFAGGSTSVNGYSFVEWGATYSPRVNFIENDKFSVSAGIPLGVGLAVGSSNYTDSYGYSNSYSTAGLILDVPLMVNINYGRGSVKVKSRTKAPMFGFFGGVGLGLNEQLLTDDSPGTGASSANLGPAVNGGVRFGLGKKGSKCIELKGYFMHGVTGAKSNEITGAVLFNF